MAIKLKMVSQFEDSMKSPLLVQKAGFNAVYIYSYDRVDIYPVRRRPGSELDQPYANISFSRTKVKWIDIKAYSVNDVTDLAQVTKAAIAFVQKHAITPERIRDAVFKAQVSGKTLEY